MQTCRRDCSRRPDGGVDQYQGQVGGGRAGRHVAGVLDMPGAVGNDELAVRGRGVAVGDVDRDALLPLGPEAVGDEGEVDLAQATALRGGLDGGQLVVEELAGVEQQSADEGALAVVDRPDRGESQKVHGVRAELGAAGRRRAGQRGHGSRSTPRACGPPWTVSEKRSSARVAPRSEMREAETSRMISSTESASDRTAPVQVASPTVRKRTVSLRTCSPSSGVTHSLNASSMPSRSMTSRYMRVVDGGQLDPLAPDVLPDVELRPVRQWEGAQMLARAARCPGRAARARGAAAWGPTGRTSRGRRGRAPSPLPCPRRGARPPKAASKPLALMASSSVVVCRRLREAIGPGSATRPWSMESCTLATSSRAPSASTWASRYSRTSAKLWPVSTWSTGKGIRPGLKALAARWSRTAESFPPLNSRTGRSDSAATSRMMKMASDSSRSRCPRGCSTGLTRAVTDPPAPRRSRARGGAMLVGSEGRRRCPWGLSNHDHFGHVY